MKKIYLLFSVLMASVSSFAQYSEDFESTAGGNTQVGPTGWSTVGSEWQFQNSGGSGPGWGVTGAVDHTTGSGIFAWVDGSSGIATNELITSSIPVTGSAPHVGFWLLSYNDDNNGAQNSISVEVNDGSGWVMLGTYAGNNPDYVKVEFPIPVSVVSPAQFRMVIIETVVSSAFYNDMIIDDFFVEDYVCFSPFALSIPSLTAFTADLSWGTASGATGYKVEGGTPG
jgi:hypothetical protein